MATEDTLTTHDLLMIQNSTCSQRGNYYITANQKSKKSKAYVHIEKCLESNQ